VVNISGGLRTIYCAGEDALVAAFQQLGTKSRVPNLWIYARNDSFFTPTLVEKIPAAFREGGGSAELVLLPSTGVDGHALFVSSNGRLRWLAELDVFLRSRGLPAWQESDVDALMRKTNPQKSIEISITFDFSAGSPTFSPTFAREKRTCGSRASDGSSFCSRRLSDSRPTANQRLTNCPRRSPIVPLKPPEGALQEEIDAPTVLISVTHCSLTALSEANPVANFANPL
jgi:hypothetical protein